MAPKVLEEKPSTPRCRPIAGNVRWRRRPYSSPEGPPTLWGLPGRICENNPWSGKATAGTFEQMAGEFADVAWSILSNRWHPVAGIGWMPFLFPFLGPGHVGAERHHLIAARMCCHPRESASRRSEAGKMQGTNSRSAMYVTRPHAPGIAIAFRQIAQIEDPFVWRSSHMPMAGVSVWIGKRQWVIGARQPWWRYRAPYLIQRALAWRGPEELRGRPPNKHRAGLDDPGPPGLFFEHWQCRPPQAAPDLHVLVGDQGSASRNTAEGEAPAETGRRPRSRAG